MLLKKKTALLRYLESIGDDPQKVISGEMYLDDETWGKLKEVSGKTPALMGIDYCRDWGLKPSENAAQAIQWKKLNSLAIAHWNAGGLVRVICHFPNPTRENFGGLRDNTPETVNTQAILTSGTPERARWHALLGEVANGLLDLNAHGVIPIFGPLHESNINAFWWGRLTFTPEQQAALWKDVFNFFQTRGIVAVWLNAQDHGPPIREGAWVDECIDLGGLDIYTREKAHNFGLIKEKYDWLLSKKKPFILSESGAYQPGNKKDADGSYNCAELLRQIRAHTPKAAAFMFWCYQFSSAKSQNLKGLLDDKNVLTLGEVAYEGR